MEIILARDARLYRVSLAPMNDGRAVVTTRFGRTLAMAAGGYHHHFTGDPEAALRRACELVHRKLRSGFRLDTGDLAEWPEPSPVRARMPRATHTRQAARFADTVARLIPSASAVLL